jgi:flagellar motor protein MotB
MFVHGPIGTELDDPFGPGTDLVLSLAAVLLLLFGVFANRGIDMLEAKQNQMRLISALAKNLNTRADETGPDQYRIAPDVEIDAITIENSGTLQRIRFGGSLLFDTNSVELKEGGHWALEAFYQALEPLLGEIEEIKIEGHADIRPPKNMSNLELAALRAIAVHQLLCRRGVDPTGNLMSASSFGEFRPIQRKVGEPYDRAQLRRNNSTDQEMELNRRIEINLTYRWR